MIVSENSSAKSNANQGIEPFIDLLRKSNHIHPVDAYEQKFYSPGQVIFEEGNTVTGAYLILEGRVKTFKSFGLAKQQFIKMRGKGEVFGFVPFLKGKKDNDITVMADSNLTVLFIPAKSFSFLVHGSPAIRQFLLLSFSREINTLKSSLRYKVNQN